MGPMTTHAQAPMTTTAHTASLRWSPQPAAEHGIRWLVYMLVVVPLACVLVVVRRIRNEQEPAWVTCSQPDLGATMTMAMSSPHKQLDQSSNPMEGGMAGRGVANAALSVAS
jgi:hypothetical protein